MQFRKTSLLQVSMYLILAAASSVLCHAARRTSTSGFVYVATNQPTGNKVIQFRRTSEGSLVRMREASTGGKGGTGNGVGNLDPLGSQDSLVLNDVGSLLLVVNAGSNQLSALQAGRNGLRLLSIVPSGGMFPNSVALHGNLVYVLNAHSASIQGFRVSAVGVLQAIQGSSRALPGGNASAAHDIRFSPDGTRVIVAEGGTNEIDIFELSNGGIATSMTQQPSAGSGPFGMRFGRGDVLINAEANSNSLSSYTLTDDDMLSVISGAIPDTQMATCWITLTGDARVGFVSNTASGTLSSYSIASDGTLTLDQAVAGSLGSGAPIDSSLSDDSAFLYVVDSALGRVVIFAVNGSSLAEVGAVDHLPTTVQGMAAQ